MYIDQLINEIKYDKDVSEIVKDRLAYLNSEEYQSKRAHLVSQRNNNLILWDGFIPTTQYVNYNFSSIEPSNLVAGSNKIYEDFVLFLKEKVLAGVDLHHKYPMFYPKNFFNSLPEESPYYEYINEIKETGYYEGESLREFVQEFISRYESAKKYIPNMDQFTSISYMYDAITPEDYISNSEYKLFAKVYRSITEENNLEIPLDALKGTRNVAMCTEHAFFYQNIMAFLGYPILMVSGIVNGNGHSYNFIYDKGEWKIHDTVQGKRGVISYSLGKEFTEEDIIDIVFNRKEINIPEENLTYSTLEYGINEFDSIEQEEAANRIRSSRR